MWRKHRRVLVILAAAAVTVFVFSASPAVAGANASELESIIGSLEASAYRLAEAMYASVDTGGSSGGAGEEPDSED